MYKKFFIATLFIISSGSISNSFSMMVDDEYDDEKNSVQTDVNWDQLRSNAGKLVSGLYHGFARTIVERPFNVLSAGWYLYIKREGIKNHPGLCAGYACEIGISTVHNGFFKNKIKNSFLKTLVDRPFYIGLAVQKLLWDRKSIEAYPFISTWVGLDILWAFARNYRQLNSNNSIIN